MKINAPLLAAAAFVAACPFVARATAVADVPEVAAEGYQLVYRDALPASAGGATFSYDVDNSATTAPTFDRVAYYLELQSDAVNAPRQYVFVSFDKLAGMTAANKTGVPTTGSGELYQQTLTNMNVASNVAGVATGTGLSTGNIEFWPTDYATANGIAIPNASGSTYDFGDTQTPGGYGSMQLQNHDLDGAGAGTAGQTIFAYNRWSSGGGNSDLGIGNGPGHPDWTFSANAGMLTIKNLEVLVRPVPEPASLGLAAAGLLTLRRRRSR